MIGFPEEKDRLLRLIQGISFKGTAAGPPNLIYIYPPPQDIAVREFNYRNHIPVFPVRLLIISDVCSVDGQAVFADKGF